MEILKKYNYNDIYNEEYNKTKKMLQNTIKLTFDFNFDNISKDFSPLNIIEIRENINKDLDAEIEKKAKEYANDKIKNIISMQLFNDFFKEGKITVEVLGNELSDSYFDEKMGGAYKNLFQNQILTINDIDGFDISFKQSFFINKVDETIQVAPDTKEPIYNLKNFNELFEILYLMENNPDLDISKIPETYQDVTVAITKSAKKI